MIEPALIDRVLFRVPQIEAMLSDPATAADQKQFRKLLKEHSHLKGVAEKANRYRTLLQRIEENRVMLAEGADPELAELAEAEKGEKRHHQRLADERAATGAAELRRAINAITSEAVEAKAALAAA